jgi:hypothetical protein
MKVVSLNQSLKLSGFAIVSAGLLYASGYLVDYLTSSTTTSLWLRWLGVLVAVGSTVPWLLFIAWMVSTMDEYQRHVTVVGTAVAFVGELLVHIGFNVMQAASLVSWSTHLQELPVAGIVWLIGIAGSAFYYRLRL